MYFKMTWVYMLSNTCDIYNYADDNTIGSLSDDNVPHREIADVDRRIIIVKLVRVELYASQS